MESDKSSLDAIGPVVFLGQVGLGTLHEVFEFDEEGTLVFTKAKPPAAVFRFDFRLLF